MLGAWGDQALPEVTDIRGFLEDFGRDERIPEWVLDTLDLLVQENNEVEVSNVKYRKLRSLNGTTVYVLTSTRS